MRSMLKRLFVTAMALLISGCDAIYFVRLDLGSHPAGETTPGARPLTPEERDSAVTVFLSAAKELGLSCHPDPYPIISGSYDKSLYRLTACGVENEFTRI